MPPYSVYILYSSRIGKYYTGFTSDIKKRLEEHNHPMLFNNWSRLGIPWELILEIKCTNKTQAILIEKHIKKNKSSVYIENLIKYPEMTVNLKQKFR